MSLGHSPTIVSDGLQLHLDAGNIKSYPGSGSTWTDISGRAAGATNFTLTNASYYSYSALNRGSILFSRTVPPTAEDGGYAAVTATGSLTALTYLHGNHTTEMWFRIVNNQPTFYTVNESASALMVYVGFHSGFYYNAQNFYYNIWGKNALAADVSNEFSFPYSDISLGVWNQIVARRSGTQLNLYLNGALKVSGTITVLDTGTGSTNVLRIGVGNYAGDFSWHANAFVSSVKMYNRGLTDAEILQNFNALRGRYGI
jgi:hypothetical protein